VRVCVCVCACACTVRACVRVCVCVCVLIFMDCVLQSVFVVLAISTNMYFVLAGGDITESLSR